MSNPKNILEKYRTYSYHHVLVACENTQVAEGLENTVNMYDYLYENYDDRHKARDAIGGQYVIIANGLVDSDFIIDDVTWISVITPQPGKESMEQSSSFLVEGSLKILEPRGVNFLNILAQVSDTLKTDPVGLVFMLKTFFVGDADTESVDYETTINPILFIMTDISSVFDVKGAEYSVEYVNVANGAAKLPQYVTGADRVSFCLNSSLKISLDSLAGKINDQYKDHLIELKIIAAETKQTLVGQEVEYEIKLDEKYAEYTINQDATHLKNMGFRDGEAAVFTFGQNPSIESAIVDILSRSKQCGDDAAGKNAAGEIGSKKYLPKIMSTLSSGINAKTGKSFFKVIYRVVKSEIPVSTIEQAQSTDDTLIGKGNAMEFDYYFSGKNTDIVDFQIRMQMGIAFFQTTVTSDSTTNRPKTPNEEVDNSQKVTAANSVGLPASNATLGARINTPILFSTIIKRPKQKNTVYPLASSDFQALLARHAAFEMLDAKITIAGNPMLLNSMAMLPSDVVDDPNFVPQDNDIFRKWSSTPSLVKVNIFMPSDKKDDDYKQKFWYNGWYYIAAIEHKFSGGKFTQVLDMFSLPLEQYVTPKDKPIKKVESPS